MIAQAEQITNELRRFGDPIYPGFASWPVSILEAASNWANLLDNATLTIFPVVSPPVRLAAKSSLTAQLATAFAAGGGVHSLPAAFQVYAAALAVGMQPLFTATPPPIPLNLLPILALQTTTPTAVATMLIMGTLISNWFKTGTAVNNASGVITSWL